MSKISGVIAILFMAALAAAASAVAAAASPVFNINLEYFNFLPHDDQNDPYVLYSE
uniref:Uncharacterized protein n=1 Tax=Megaselia scalaris TaxID=36166 RepID=T1GJP9_MEGSC